MTQHQSNRRSGALKTSILSIAALALAVNFVSVPSALAAKGDGQLGYVNMQRAVVEVEEGKRARAKLEKTFKAKQSALQKKEKDLEKLKKAIDISGITPEKAATDPKLIEFRKKLLELREEFAKEQKEIKDLEAKALQGITKKLRTIIQALGKKGKYLLILEATEGSLLYAKPHLDITNEVIRVYNSKHP